MKKKINIKKLFIEDLEALAVGSSILGSGGGGDATNDLLMAKYLFKKNGSVLVLQATDLDDSYLVVPIAFMGAPSISKEKIPSGKEFKVIIEKIKNYFPNKKIIFMAGEIGGANAFTPIIAASILNYPVLDADTIGRAFPELQMSSCNLHKIPISPTFLTCSKGNTVIIDAKDTKEVENLARASVIKMGSNACVSLYIMKGSLAKKVVIKNSLSRAIKIGRAIIEANQNKKDPIKALLKITKGICLFQGVVEDVSQKIIDGFLQGSLIVTNNKKRCEVRFQNENLLVKVNNEIIVTTPDIISIVETDSGKPISNESLCFGQRVSVISFPSPNIWTTKKGLSLVGPRVFGINIDYKPTKRN